jgi:membrane protease subunit HflC
MRLVLILLLFVGLLLARISLFTVDRSEFVYLTQFGRHVATFDGAQDAGLHVRWPWPIQSVTRLDRRLQSFDLPGAELLTRDPRGNTIDKTLTLDAYVCWRIGEKPGSVDRFIRTVGTIDSARALLGQRINSELGAAVGQMELDDLISTDPGKVDQERDRLRSRLLDGVGQGSLRDLAADQYGIEVIDIRLRRINHPPAVRQAIFERIDSERSKRVAEYQSEGERRAKDITSKSEREVRVLKAEAEAEAIRIRGQASAEADRIGNEAQRLDPQFYTLLKKLDAYKQVLGDNKTVLLLSTHRELFDTLFNPPAPAKKPGEKEKQ